MLYKSIMNLYNRDIQPSMVVVIALIAIFILYCLFGHDGIEGFQHGYYRRRPRYYNRSYPYSYEWYNYPNYYDYWGNPWGYLPCINDAFGKLKCY